MKVRPVHFTVLFCFFFLLPEPVCAFTLYMKEYVITGKEKLTVGDIVSFQPGAASLLPGAAGQELPYSPEKISLIPAAQVKNLVAGYYPEAGVIIGQQTAVIPEKLITGSCQSFIFQFIRFIDSLRKSREYRIDVLPVTPFKIPVDCTGNSFTFALAARNFKAGALYGKAEISCENTKGQNTLFEVYIEQYLGSNYPVPGEGKNPGMVFSKESVFTDLKPADTALPEYKKAEWKVKAVRAGDMITIHFYKGNIYLKMDGLAYSSGAKGDTVSVKPATTYKRFKATVTGEKEVRVEIP